MRSATVLLSEAPASARADRASRFELRRSVAADGFEAVLARAAMRRRSRHGAGPSSARQCAAPVRLPRRVRRRPDRISGFLAAVVH
jgi:hypothetical protein